MIAIRQNYGRNGLLKGPGSRPLYVSSSSLVFLAVLIVTSVQYSLAQEISASLAKVPETNFKLDAIKQQYVTVENLRIRYIEVGQGRPVVMIHGNAGDVEDFEFGLVDSLSRSFKVFAYDRPGHGASDRRGGKESSVDFQAQLLHETLSRLGINQPILVGHSWGCALALDYALKYPNETSGLVLLAPAAYPDSSAGGLLRFAVKTPGIGDLTLLFGKIVLCQSLLRRDLERAFYPQPVPKDYFKVAESSWLGRKQLKAYLEDEWALNNSLKAISNHYSELRLPVTIVTGDEDQIVSPRENAYRLKASIPQAQLIDLPDTGHEIPLTHPESVYAALTRISSAPEVNAAQEKPVEATGVNTAVAVENHL